MRELEVLLLCGGLGTRLHRVVPDRPKPMADMQGRPFLDILIHHVSAFGRFRYILCTGYKADYIEHYYEPQAGPGGMRFSRENTPLGTAGGLKKAEPLISSNPFLVLNGDSFCPVDIEALLSFHQNKKALISMVVSARDDAYDYGSLWMDEEGRITRFREKITSGRNLINAGIYVMNKEVLSEIPPDIPYSLENDLFPTLAGKNFFGFLTSEEVVDIGTPERYEWAKKVLC